VKRLSILVALLALFLAACGAEQASDTATLTPEPTPEATSDAPEPTEEPAETDDDDGDGGSDTALADMIPDELNGAEGTTISAFNDMLEGMLQQQGVDAGDAEFAFVTYGEGPDAVVLNGFRIPGVSEDVIQQLARVMSLGEGQEDVEIETINVGGKEVLSFSGTGAEGVVYFYAADDVAFTVAGQDAGLVEQLLSELP
jgi:hypothetical protein